MASHLHGVRSAKTSWRERLRAYASLVKSLQTGLLLLTGLAGWASARCPVLNLDMLTGAAASLFLAISGGTVLNMVMDRDIDARMARTCWRPLPSGRVGTGEALALGLSMSVLGITLAVALSPLFGTLVFAGLVFDVVIYTAWLKRRTAWSVVWGGISGGMPILAGRALGTGTIDWIGIALALAILFWIPTHILTFSLRYREDYGRAGIPTFPSQYGEPATRAIITFSSLAAAAAIVASAVGIGLAWGFLRLLAVLSFGLFLLAVATVMRPSERAQFGLFKYASVYMMSAMLVLLAGVA